LRLHARDSVGKLLSRHQERATTLHFRVNRRARRINDVDALLDALENFINAGSGVASTRRSSTRRDGDAALALLSIQSVTVVPSHFADLWIMPV